MSRLTIVVAGMLAADPYQGGATWAVLQYVLGLRQLGHDVVVVDPLSSGAVTPGVRTYFDAVRSRFELEGRAALVPSDGEPYGLASVELDDVVSRTDVLINLSGRWRAREQLARIPVRAFVDLDPAFTQLWHADGVDVGLGGHTHHVTVGGRVADETSAVAAGDIAWTAIVPPVVLDHWPVDRSPAAPRLTTVANWRSYGSIFVDGCTYGQKAHSFRRLCALPQSSRLPLSVALSIHAGDDADRRALIAAGWLLVDPVTVAGDPDSYRRFVRRSWAELGVAKSGYVTGRTGWLSDRTACYLASGRPAIVQDTGLSGVVPVGSGLLTFEGIEDAAAAIDAVAADYERHRLDARRIAEAHFDSRLVLSQLLERLLG